MQVTPYVFHITFYDIAFFGMLFIGFTFVLLLWFTRNVKRSANRFLAAALATAALWMAHILAVDVRLPTCAPMQFSLAFGPLIYFYVRKITKTDDQFRRGDLLHFSPLLLELAIQVDAFALQRLNPVLPPLVFISVIIYIYQCRTLIGNYYQQQKFTGVDRYRHELRWLHRLITGFEVLWLSWIPFTVIGYFYQFSPPAYYPLYLVFMSMMIWIAAAAHSRRNTAEDTLVAFKQLPAAEVKQKGTWLKKMVKENRYYEDPELSLSTLAGKLGLTTHELSRIINTAFKKSFSDFINEYRIRDITSKMQDPAFQRFTLLGIAFSSGFNSRTNFHRTFKEMTGKSPAGYKAALKKEIPYYNSEHFSRSAKIISFHDAIPVWSGERENRNYMFNNYLKIAWRNALKNRSHSLISLGSLVLGLTFFCLITLWVKDELSFDKGFKSAGRICRVETRTITKDGTSSNLASVGWPVGKALASEYPEIEDLTYMTYWAPAITFKGNKYFEDALYADQDFFKIFSYELIEGNASTALKEPRSVVITEALREKYFGKGNALGKVLMVNDTIPYKITGVIKKQAMSSHLQFDMLGSFSSQLTANPKAYQEDFTSGWFDINVYNYVKLRPNVDPAALSAKIQDLVQRDGKAAVAATGFSAKLSLRPIGDIYLYSGMATENGPLGSIKLLRLFTIIGLFILIIACLNFINLTTAKSIERAKEIGIKKVLGSSRKQIIRQFLMESALFCIVAMAVSISITMLILPLFNMFAGREFSLSTLFTPGNLLLIAGILALIIPLAGFYPAMVLSSYQQVKVLKGSFSHSGSGNTLRKALVVVQFLISIGFILCTMVIWNQLTFMQSQNLGFDKDRILLINTNKMPRKVRNSRAEAFKNTLLSHSDVQNVTACWAVPGRAGWNGQFAYPEGRSKEHALIVEYIPVDSNYARTLGLTFIAGHDFLPGSASDQQKNTIINEAAVKTFGWKDSKDAIGKKLTTSGKEGVIIGVLRDYHQHGLQDQIKPVVLGIGDGPRVFAIKYRGNNPDKVVKEAKSDWIKAFSGYEFNYKFLDEDFQQQYVKEKKFETLFEIAAVLSISIACLGLLGLAIFTAQKRTKEIGIRKVLGATAGSIVIMLSADFLRLVLISLLIASPLAWFAMHNWLEGFAYHISIPWLLFPLAGIVVILIALLTTGVQALRAAWANPVKSLRSE